MVLVGLLAALIAWANIDLRQRRINDYAFIEAPLANDIYLVNLSMLPHGSGGSALYGVMMIKSVSGGRVAFKVSKAGYTKTFGPVRDVADGQALSAE